MQAVILAAGMGKRMGTLTDETPKALVKTPRGVPFIVAALRAVKAAGIDRALIVTGYKGELLRETLGEVCQGVALRYLQNDRYAVTNNIYSLWLAGEAVNEDVLLLECDVLLTPGLLERFLSSPEADCRVMVSPYCAATMNGTVVFTKPGGMEVCALATKRQQKGLDLSRAWKTVNIYTFKKAFFLDKFVPMMRTYMEIQDADSYYEQVLGALVYYQNDTVSAVTVSPEDWLEIDTQEELQQAQGWQGFAMDGEPGK